MAYHLEPLCEDHFERLHAVFDSVCRERRFMAFTHAGPMEETVAYYRKVLESQATHFVAVSGNEVVGWCDVLRQFAHAKQHAGTLGMAVAANHRGRGIGRALIEATIAHASDAGLTRIELTVHSENLVAQALYRSVGFRVEGIQVRAWRISGQHFDVLSMARLSDA